MYNHYIPQSDGSFRKNSVPEQNKRPSRNPPIPPAPPAVPKPTEPPKPPPPPKTEHCPPAEPIHKPESPLAFLRKLLPKQIDTADLIIIALLLLISMEDDCDDLSPILTIALYFLL